MPNRNSIAIPSTTRRRMSGEIIEVEGRKVFLEKGTNDQFYNFLRVDHETKFDSLGKNYEDDMNTVMFAFPMHVAQEIGPFINRIWVALAKSIGRPVVNIFNGSDFVVPGVIRMANEEYQIRHTYQLDSGIRIVTPDTLRKITDEIQLDNQTLVDDLLFNAQNYLSLGYLDMAVLHAHIAFEVCVGRFFCEDMFPSKDVFNVFKAVKEKPFVSRWLNYAPLLAFGCQLETVDKDLFEDMVVLNGLRNKIAHEGSCKNHRSVVGLTAEELADYIDDLIDGVHDIRAWLQKLAINDSTRCS
ncbi:MAG: hypothetical protein ACM3UZ_10470 [Acidobacteriota bacterium]